MGAEGTFPSEAQPDADVVRPDARSLRGLAHPLRVRLLGLLRAHGPSTATRLAERVGESSGATSYHLRQLAAYGFVVEEPDRGSGRERWWRAAHRSTVFDARLVDADDEEATALSEDYLAVVAGIYAERLLDGAGRTVTEPDPAWARAAGFSDVRLALAPADAEQLDRDILALLERLPRAEGGVLPPGTRAVVVQWQILPEREDEA